MRRTILLTLVIFTTTIIPQPPGGPDHPCRNSRQLSAGGLYQLRCRQLPARHLADGGATDSHYLASGSRGRTRPDIAMAVFPFRPMARQRRLVRLDLSSFGHGNEASGDIDNITTFTSPMVAARLTITGQWSTDNAATGILLNGVSTGNANNNEFETFHAVHHHRPDQSGREHARFHQQQRRRPRRRAESSFSPPASPPFPNPRPSRPSPA